VKESDPEAPTQAGVAPNPMHASGRPPPHVEAFERGTIVDRYTILERVGKGGMGEVYAAYDSKLDRRVALKLLLSPDEGGESRLAREAQAMARLSHPNVVAVFDTGVIEGRRFLAMEFVQGSTLRGWLHAAKRTIPEILKVYMQAGRGLAAAHEAGLVHRDFKPDNVLVSPQGAVKVTDFGLVRAEEDEEARRADVLEKLAARLASSGGGDSAAGKVGADPETMAPTDRMAALSLPSPSSSNRSLDTPMTEAGALLGTLGYMAPEQYLSEPVNAKTDQFAFAVALWDALYGQKPFEGKGVLELADATVNGRLRVPPRGSSVPTHIHRVLVRALKPEKSDRYPSLQLLLEDLARDPAAQRRKVVTIAAVALATLGVIVQSQRVLASRQGKLCSAAEPLAHEVWNDAVKRDVEASMVGTGVTFAKDTWTRTEAQLDAYMAKWARMHEETCRATRIAGYQPEPLMTVRMACLEQRRAQVKALTHVLDHADRQTVERAVEASKNLPAVEDCGDVTSLTSVKTLPASPEQRAAIEALGREVGELRVRADAGKYKDVTSAAVGLVERVRATGYEPLLADALLVLGDAQDHLGLKTDAATTLREAAYAAEAGRADEVKTRALVLLIGVLADQRKFDEADVTSQFASASSSRLTDPEAYRAELYSANAWVACRAGRYDDSAALFRKAIAVAERNADAKPVRLARMYSRAGGMLGDAGHFDEAFDLLDRADATFVRVLGADHPARLAAAVNRGATYLDKGDWAHAVETSDKALVLAARALPPESGTLANLHNNRADALIELKEYDDAIATSHRAVEIGKAVFGPKAVNTAGFMITYGEALARAGRSDDAVAAINEVLSILEPALPADHEWLGEARATRGGANVARHAPRDAIVDLERALVTYKGITHKTFVARQTEAFSQAMLARALWETGTRTPRVGELVKSALGTYEAMHLSERTQKLAEWARESNVPLPS
jgi:serine/threonine protein kinase/tetratricopeptide (TPR) repeat protein